MDSWVREICWRRDRLPTSVFLGFPCGSTGKEYAYKVGDLGSIPGLGRSPPLQYSGLENSMDCIVDGVAKSRTRLSDFHFHRENNSGRRRDFPLRYKTIKQTKTNGLLHTVSQLKQSKCESGKKKNKTLLWPSHRKPSKCQFLFNEKFLTK